MTVVMNYEDGKRRGYPIVPIRLKASQHSLLQQDGSSKPLDEVGSIHDVVVIRQEGDTYLGLDSRDWTYTFEINDLYLYGHKLPTDPTVLSLYDAFCEYGGNAAYQDAVLVPELRLYPDGSGSCSFTTLNHIRPRLHAKTIAWANITEGYLRIKAKLMLQETEE